MGEIKFYEDGVEPTQVVEQNIQQEPAKAEPVTPTEQKAEQPQDVSAYVKEKFGLDESELSERLTKFSEYEKLNKELAESNPYKSDYGRQIDELIAEGMEFNDAVEFLQLDVEKMVSVDKITRHLKSTVAKGLSDSQIKDYILEDLGYSLSNLDEEEKQEIWNNLTPSQQIKLNKMTDEANQFLVSKKESLKNSAPKRHEVLQGKENLERIKAWEREIPSMITDKITEKVKDLDVVFEVPKEEKAEVAKLALSYAEQAGLDVSNKENLEHVKSYATNVMRLRNFDKFMELAFNSGSSKQLDADLNKFENPQISRQRNAPSEKGKITFYE